MRFLFFLVFLQFSTFAQLSKTSSFHSDEIVESVSFAYGSENSSYFAATTYSSTGGLTKGIRITKLDQCDSIVWNKTYSLASGRLIQKQILSEVNGDNIFVLGYKEDVNTSDKMLYLLKLSKDGDVIFSKTYDFGDYLYGNVYEHYSTNDGIIIHGKFPKVGGGFSHGGLIHIGKNGNIINSNKFLDSFTGLSTIQITEDSYMIRTSSYLYLTHIDGTVYWAKQFDEILQGSNFFQGQKSSEGNVFVIGRQKEYYLVKFSDLGEVIWKTDKISFEFWPQLSVNKKQELVLVSFILDSGILKPLIISYNKNGEIIRQEMIDDLGVSINNYPFVNNTLNGDISAQYIASNSKSIVFSENISNSDCLIPISLPTLSHSKSSTSTDITLISTPMPTTAITNWDLETETSLLYDTVRCETVIIEDTLIISAKIDCDHSYFYTDNSINSTYYWPQDGSTESYKDLDAAGVYTLIVENCHSRTIKHIEVEDICGCQLQIPNIFTPNNDEYNNTFKIQDLCQTSSFEIVIYDRWGKQVFESNSVEDAWDGRFKGNLVASGMYVYKIIYRPFSIIDNIPFVNTQGAFIITY